MWRISELKLSYFFQYWFKFAICIFSFGFA
jgi:hypothetical protein